MAYLGARYGRGIVLHVRGELAEALAELEDAVARADALGQEGARRAARYFQHDPRISCRSYDAFTHWLLGDRDAAAARRAELLALTRHDSRPGDRAFALYVDAVLAGLEGDVAGAHRSGESGREVADRYGLRYWRSMLTVCAGWAAVHGGAQDAGIGLLRTALGESPRLGHADPPAPAPGLLRGRAAPHGPQGRGGRGAAAPGAGGGGAR